MPEAPTPLSPTSERRQQLAERFGMTPDAVERILTDTHDEYAATTVASEQNPPVAKRTSSGTGGGLTAAILVALFVILGITMSFKKGCFEQRNHASKVAQKPVDTVQTMMNDQTQAASTPPVTPSDVDSNEVPPEALVVPNETPGASNSGITTMAQAVRQSRPVAVTSSYFEAQERLAELKSEGRSRARMVRRKGQYEVFAR
jgi:hypothetical protein